MNLKGKLTPAFVKTIGVAVLLPVLFLCLFIAGPFTGDGDAQSTPVAVPAGPPTSLAELEKEFLSFFTTAAGTIIEVAQDRVTLDIGSAQTVRKGMRFFVYREGSPFVHPVTKEPLGKVEIPLGQVEVIEATPDRAHAKILSGKPDELKGAKVKIQQFKVKVLFYQGNVDWYLGDAYYQMLRKNNRVELIDTSLDIRDISVVGAEGKKKGAEVILVLAGTDAKDTLAIEQQLFWAGDMQKFSDKRVTVPLSALNELRYKSGSFGPKEGEALLSYVVPSGMKFVAAGDFEGNKEQKIALASGSTVKIYKMGADLTPFAQFSLPESREILWMEAFSPGTSRKDLIIITGRSDDPDRFSDPNAERPRVPLSYITSSVYEYRDTGFVRIAKFDFTFIRQIDGHVITQEYSNREIYEGPVRKMLFDGTTFTPGETLKLPKGVGIYDFQFVRSPEGVRGILVWNDNGYLTMYNDEGVRIWMSREDYGGFLQTYAKRATTIMTETEKWVVKDKLLDFRGEVLAPKRTALLRNAKTLGYSKSTLKSLWWSGLGVEERNFIEEIDGTLLDFAVVGDRMAVLSKPLFGLKARNILKGDNPFVVMLSIYAIKGR